MTSEEYEDIIEEYSWIIYDKLDDEKIDGIKASRLSGKLGEWERKFNEMGAK